MSPIVHQFSMFDKSPAEGSDHLRVCEGEEASHHLCVLSFIFFYPAGFTWLIRYCVFLLEATWRAVFPQYQRHHLQTAPPAAARPDRPNEAQSFLTAHKNKDRQIKCQEALDALYNFSSGPKLSATLKMYVAAQPYLQHLRDCAVSDDHLVFSFALHAARLWWDGYRCSMRAARAPWLNERFRELSFVAPECSTVL